jgi:hypothetical protein
MSENSIEFNNSDSLNLSGSTLNPGTISGNVTNTINQLSDTSQPELQAHLKELQSAIESSNLPDQSKATALEQVKTLAEASQNPDQPEKKGMAEKALTFLKGMASMLPDTAKLAEACAKLLPLIAKVFGIPVVQGMKRVPVSELQQHAIEYLSGDEAIAIEHEGKILGYFHPSNKTKQARVEQAVKRLQEVMDKALAETGMTEDEFVDLFDLSKPLPNDDHTSH